MNNKNEIQKTLAGWVMQVNKSMDHKTGKFFAKDTFGVPIVLEWEKVDLKSARLNEIIKDVSDILVQTYVTMELAFARKHPDTISSEMFLKYLEPLFKDGIEKVDWNLVEQKIHMHLQQFFTTTDFMKYSNADDVQVFVVAKDAKTGSKIGIIQFLITPEFAHGTVKVAFYGVASSAQNHGIEQLLMSSIFKLVPEVARIFLHARITNNKAITMYREWGFTQFAGPLTYWTDMEYVTEKSDILQKIAEHLKS